MFAEFESCGMSGPISFRQPRANKTAQGRIINGKKSEKGAWPWQVGLGEGEADKNKARESPD
jgi:secreted trypsin-like serine protease